MIAQRFAASIPSFPCSVLRQSRRKGESGKKRTRGRKDGDAQLERRVPSVWTGSPPFLCHVSSKKRASALVFRTFPLFSTKATPSRLDYSRIAGLSGAELGLNHSPWTIRDTRRGGVLDGRRRGLKSLELGSPLRLVQLLSCAPFWASRDLGKRVLGFSGVFELQKLRL